MRRQIVEDDVDIELRLDAPVDFAQEGDEVLRPMLGFAPGVATLRAANRSSVP